jgi:hypothetical protein
MSQTERFIEEVVSRGAEACLPRNLSDEWLLAATHSAEEILEGLVPPKRSSDADPPGTIALAAIMCILKAKNASGDALNVSHKRLYGYVKMYCIELSLEQIHRRTDIKYEPASLNSILTKRDVTTWKE